MLGGLAAGALWVMNSRAHSLQTLYLAAAIGGLGIGCVFGTSMGTALKWFPERRGFPVAAPGEEAGTCPGAATVRGSRRSSVAATGRQVAGSFAASAIPVEVI